MANSDIVVTPVDGKADLKAFIQLPVRLYAGHKGYIPHLNVERQEAFSPEEEPAVPACRGPVLPRPPRRPVWSAASSAQIDRAYLERYADDTGHFGCLVAEDDPAIFAALFAGGRGLAARQGHEAQHRPVQPVGQRGGRPAGRRLRQPADADGALRSALFGRRGSRPTATPRSRTCSPTTTTSRTRPRRSARS